MPLLPHHQYVIRWGCEASIVPHSVFGLFSVCKTGNCIFPYFTQSCAQNTKWLVQKYAILDKLARHHELSSPWASGTIICHSSVFLKQTDLLGPPNIEAPMSSKQLHPEDGQKQNKLTAGLAWALLRSTISGTAWRQHFWFCFHTALWNFYTVPNTNTAHQNMIDSQVLHLREAPRESERAWSWFPHAFINSLV